MAIETNVEEKKMENQQIEYLPSHICIGIRIFLASTTIVIGYNCRFSQYALSLLTRI